MHHLQPMSAQKVLPCSLSSLERQNVMPMYTPTNATFSGLAHSPHVPPHREPHTWIYSLFIAASPHASPNGSSLPGLHTPGCSPSSSRRLLMSAKKDFHSLDLPTILMWLLTENHTPGCTPSSPPCLFVRAQKDLHSLYFTHLDALPLHLSVFVHAQKDLRSLYLPTLLMCLRQGTHPHTSGCTASSSPTSLRAHPKGYQLSPFAAPSALQDASQPPGVPLNRPDMATGGTSQQQLPLSDPEA